MQDLVEERPDKDALPRRYALLTHVEIVSLKAIRPTTAWTKPCANCPSMRPPDPEALDMEELFKQGKITFEQATFPCAWRPKKLCFGICKRMDELIKQQRSKKVIYSTAEKHQYKIAVDTVKNPNKDLLGGPSLEEAKEILKTKFKFSEEEIEKLEE